MKVLISVIIPHYNSYGLLRRALDSIPKRGDVEIIVVDDYSSEPSAKEIVAEKKYDHVCFSFLRKKSNAGKARNIGLNMAKGRYVLFLDSDDYFSKTAFELFINTIESKKELYQFHSTSFIEGTNEEGIRHRYMTRYYRMKNRTGLLGIVGPVAKLIKLEFIRENKIYFSDVPAGNDVVFSTLIACKSMEYEFIDNVVYHISQNNQSLTATINLENSVSRIKEATKRTMIVKDSEVVNKVIYFSKYHSIDSFAKLKKELKNKKFNKLYYRYILSLPPLSVFLWLVDSMINISVKRLKPRIG